MWGTLKTCGERCSEQVTIIKLYVNHTLCYLHRKANIISQCKAAIHREKLCWHYCTVGIHQQEESI